MACQCFALLPNWVFLKACVRDDVYISSSPFSSSSSQVAIRSHFGSSHSGSSQAAEGADKDVSSRPRGAHPPPPPEDLPLRGAPEGLSRAQGSVARAQLSSRSRRRHSTLYCYIVLCLIPFTFQRTMLFCNASNCSHMHLHVYGGARSEPYVYK